MSLSVSDFDALLLACGQHCRWLLTQFDSAKRKEMVNALVTECEWHIGNHETDPEYVGKLASVSVRIDPQAVPYWLAIKAFEELGRFVAKWLLDHQRAPADFAKGEST